MISFRIQLRRSNSKYTLFLFSSLLVFIFFASSSKFFLDFLLNTRRCWSFIKIERKIHARTIGLWDFEGEKFFGVVVVVVLFIPF